MQTKHRRIEILSRILNGEIFSKTEIAENLNLAEISISRDINFFRKIGIPIYSRNKKLVIELHSSINNVIRFIENYISSISNSQNAFPKSDIDKLKYLNFIAYINFAITRNMNLEIRYRRLYDKHEKYYKIIPENLSVNRFNWILQAVDTENFITKSFYISRIESITTIENKITDYSKKIIPRETYKMQFRFSKEVAEQIKSKVWFENQRIEVLEDGKVDFFIEEEISDKLAGWCVSWWDQVEVISPTELKQYLEEMILSFQKINF